MDYLFTSQRLGFRPWQEADAAFLAAMNGDKEVMQFFPAVLSQKDSDAFLQKLQTTYHQKGYCYYATELIETKKAIGMIGFGYKDFEADFTPCVDIGWRLHKPYWGNGYATEGAARCLDYGFAELGFQEVLSIAPKINTTSIKVMENIGLRKVGEFNHPQLSAYLELENCVVFGSKKSQF